MVINRQRTIGMKMMWSDGGERVALPTFEATGGGRTGSRTRTRRVRVVERVVKELVKELAKGEDGESERQPIIRDVWSDQRSKPI